MYEYGTAGVLYAAIHLAILAAIRYWLYKDRLRVQFIILVPIISLIAISSGVIWLLTGGIGDFDYESWRIASAMVMFVISCIMIKAPLAEHSFSYIMIYAVDAAIETTAFYVKTAIYDFESEFLYLAISMLLTVIAILVGVMRMKRIIDRLSGMGDSKVWAWLDVACISFLLMNLINTMPRPARIGESYLISRYLMLVGMLGIYKVSTWIMDAATAEAKTLAELDITKKLVDMQQNYYDSMTTQMEEVRRIRHDLRQHRTVLSSLAKNNNIEELNRYLDTTATEERTIPVTGNLAADSILLYYLGEAEAMHVHIESNLYFEKETSVSDSDLCVILGNLLENAVDAQRFLEEKDRYIRITAKGDKSGLTLAVDNSYDGVLYTEDGEYISRKDGTCHGLGIGSVRAICERYGGILQIETTDKMFMAGVVIGL